MDPRNKVTGGRACSVMNTQSLVQAGSFVKRYLWFIGAVLCFLLLFGSCSTGVARQIDLLIPRRQLSWPTVQGTVLGTGLQCQVPLAGESYWVLKVQFAYRVLESEYSGEQKMPLLNAVSLSDLKAQSSERFDIVRVLGSTCGGQDIVGRETWETVREVAWGRLLYHTGQPVPVYYNPEKPREGVVKPGLVFGWDMSYGEVIMIYLPLLFCFGGVGLLIAGISRFRK